MTSRILAFPAAGRRAERARPPGPLATLLGRIVMGLAESDRLYRERRYLDELDDRMLDDIGVTRAEVEAELRRPLNWSAIFFRGQ